MRNLLYVLTVGVVVGLAFWAYRENYATQQALAEVQKLQRDIGQTRTRLSVLRAEWAYLNRPDRLRELAEINFDPLGLLPLRADQFGQIDQVAYPPRMRDLDIGPVTSPVSVSSAAAEDRP